MEDWGKLLFERKNDLVESLVTAQHESIKNNAKIAVVLYNDGSIGKLYENVQNDLGKWIEIGYFNPETSSAEQDFLPEEVVEQIIAAYIE